jgi:peptide/nickel transport system permease protein
VTQEIGVIQSDPWSLPIRPLPVRVMSSIGNFARRKPLGFACGIIVLLFMLIGDVVPESLNKVSREVGLGRAPVPYLADEMVKTFGFLHPHDQQDLGRRLEGSSGTYLLGTDSIGRDVLSRLLYGTRVAVMISLGATIIAVTIGAFVGIMSGFYMGWVDKALYRLVDVFQALPGLIILIVILVLFGTGLWQMVLVLGVVFGPSQSRVIRGQTLYVMATPYIEAARIVGAGDRRIMMRYVLPNVFHLVILNATFLLGLLVLVEATISFLGYGLPPPFPSWGQMLSLDGRQYMRVSPTLAVYPGLAIGLLVFSFNIFGDALRDILDPRLRGSR